MKRFTLLVGTCAFLLWSLTGCSLRSTQYHMTAWDRNTHEKLGEWYVYRDDSGCLRTVDNDAAVVVSQATIILEEVKPPKNRMVMRQRSQDER